MIVTAVVILVCLLYVYAWIPISLKSKPLMVLSNRYLPFDPHTLGPEVAGYFYNNVQALTSQGFTVIDYLTKPGAQQNITAVMIYLINRQLGTRCTVACFYMTINGAVTVRGHNVILTTYFTENTGFTTSNVSTPSVFRSRPQFDGASFPNITNPAELVDIHRFQMSKLAAGRLPLLPPVGQELDEYHERETRSLDYQTECGLAYFDAAKQAYYRTWYGTYYMTWQLLWPFKPLNLAKKRRKAARVMPEYNAARVGAPFIGR